MRQDNKKSLANSSKVCFVCGKWISDPNYIPVWHSPTCSYKCQQEYDAEPPEEDIPLPAVPVEKATKLVKRLKTGVL